MAPFEAGLFDRLPDEMIIFILGIVAGGFQRRSWLPRVEHAKNLIRALLVCRQFEELGHQVETLVWPLRSEAEGQGLVAFVSHQCFSVKKLRLLIAAKQEDIPHSLISRDSLLKRLPKQVSVYCMQDEPNTFWGGPSCANFVVDDPEPSRNIIDTLLSISGLSSFSTSRGTFEVLTAAPISEARHVQFVNGTLSIAAVHSLLERCPFLETLSTNVHVNSDDSDGPEEVIDTCFVMSKTLRSLKLQSPESFLALDVRAPSLLSLSLYCDSLKLEAPALQELELSVSCLENPVTLVQPSSQLNTFAAYDCTWDSWTEIVVPILRQCPGLKNLTVTLDGPMTPLPIGILVSQLPPGIERLDLDLLFFSSLRSSSPFNMLSNLKDLRIDLAFEEEGSDTSIRLQSLCQATPNLERLELILPAAKRSKNDRSHIVAGFRKLLRNNRKLKNSAF